MSIPIHSQLQAIPDAWNSNPTSYAYQWQRSSDYNPGNPSAATWSSVPGAISSDYVVTVADGGCYLSTLETATNIVGGATTRSVVVGPVAGVAITPGEARVRTLKRG